MKPVVDLNADLGESYGPWPMGNDSALLDIVTSANIACGFHAGDPEIMAKTVGLCREKNVGIGAHPGFNDLHGFGRRRIHGTPPSQMEAMLIYQIGALQAIARSQGSKVRHVKMHGALSNMASEDADLAAQCIGAAIKADPELILVAVAATALQSEGEKANIAMAREVFADRAYQPNGLLVPRSTPGAVIHDADVAAERVLRMVEERAVTAMDGTKVPVEPDTICVHGDEPSAVKLAEGVRKRLEDAGVEVRTFGTA